MIIAGEKQDNGYEMLDYPGEVSYREWIYKVENCFRNQFRGSSWECWGNAGESKENIHMLFLIFPFALRLFYTIFTYIEIFFAKFAYFCAKSQISAAECGLLYCLCLSAILR